MTRDEQAIAAGVLGGFVDEGWVSEVLEVVRGGKEATVFRCRAGPRARSRVGGEWLAAKVYRPMSRRSFKDDAAYQHGRGHGKHREERAFLNKTRIGREVQAACWVAAEFETQKMLYDAGIDVPRAVVSQGNAILMEWVGDGEGAAPQLRNAKLSTAEAREVLQRLLWNIEGMLRENRVHGDLSPFNVLYWFGGVRVIDFPQAVDPRSNWNAYSLLMRDVGHVCDFAGRCGVREDAGRIGRGIWERYMRGEL